jgi:addiction module HigA family antidote
MSLKGRSCRDVNIRSAGQDGPRPDATHHRAPDRAEPGATHAPDRPLHGHRKGPADRTSAAKRLQVFRATLSRILNGKAGISADMSLRLSAAFGTHAEIWCELQTDYDLWQASQKKQPKIELFPRAA